MSTPGITGIRKPGVVISMLLMMYSWTCRQYNQPMCNTVNQTRCWYTRQLCAANTVRVYHEYPAQTHRHYRLDGAGGIQSHLILRLLVIGRSYMPYMKWQCRDSTSHIVHEHLNAIHPTGHTLYACCILANCSMKELWLTSTDKATNPHLQSASGGGHKIK